MVLYNLLILLGDNIYETGSLSVDDIQFKEKFEYSEFLVTFFQSVFNMLENIIMYAKKATEDMNEIENMVTT